MYLIMLLEIGFLLSKQDYIISYLIRVDLFWGHSQTAKLTLFFIVNWGLKINFELVILLI
jgi:hypothetical protein